MTSPGLALSAEMLCSVPSAFTILWAARTTFTSLQRGGQNKVKTVSTVIFNFMNFCMRTTSPRLVVSLGKTWLGDRSVTNGQYETYVLAAERIMVEVLVFGIVTPVPSPQCEHPKVTNVLKMRQG